MHDHHESLDGFDARQIWIDGCAECKRRADGLPRSIANLDTDSYARAIRRAIAWQTDRYEEVGPISGNEMKLLETLWLVHLYAIRLQAGGYDSKGERAMTPADAIDGWLRGSRP